MSVAGDGAEAKAAVCRFFEERASSSFALQSRRHSYSLGVVRTTEHLSLSLRQKSQIEIWYQGMNVLVLFNLNGCSCNS